MLYHSTTQHSTANIGLFCLNQFIHTLIHFLFFYIYIIYIYI